VAEPLRAPQGRVKTYPVAIEDGLVVVYADPADLPPPPPGHPDHVPAT
jgi:hypothetical protein